MPPRHRKAVIGGAVGLFLVGAIAVALWLRSGKVDPQSVKAELKSELDRINAIPADRVVEKDDQVHLVLENQTYMTYGAELYKGISRSHDVLHQQAETHRKASGDVGPFLARWKSAKSDPARLEREAQKLLDECKPLREKYGSTSFGPRLEEAAGELDAFLASRSESGWEADFLALRKKVDGAATSGDFSGALDLIRDFGKKKGEGEKPELAEKLSSLRAAVEKKGAARIEAILSQARKLSDDGKGDEARALVKSARDGLRGLPRAQDLDRFLEKE